MPSRHLTLRIGIDAFERLEAESRRTRRSRSEVAKTLLEEGLRMEKHPGILFRTGPAGRRAALAGGPDVWEIARVCRDLQVSGDRAISQTAELMALHPQQVRTALGYYADYQAELDDWIRMIDEEAEDAYASWQRQQKLFAG